MKIFALFLTVLFLFSVGTQASKGGKGGKGDNSAFFEGYWAGIDPNDGGDSRRTIVDNGNHYTMVGRDTVLTLCGGGGNGVLLGTGDMENGSLVIKGSLDCTNGASVGLTYSFTKVDGNLMVELLENADTGDLIYEAYFWRLASPAGSCY